MVYYLMMQKEFVENHNISIWIDYHIPGEVIFYPQLWNYTKPDDLNIFQSIANNISSINGYEIGKQHSWLNKSGVHGGWAYQRHGIYPLTIELFKSMKPIYFPDKIEIFNVFKTHLFVNLYIAERAISMAG